MDDVNFETSTVTSTTIKKIPMKNDPVIETLNYIHIPKGLFIYSKNKI